MTFFGRCSSVILRISGDLWYFWSIFKFDFEDYFCWPGKHVCANIWEGGTISTTKFTIHIVEEGGGTITTTKYTIHTVPFWTYYEIFWPIFYSDFEDFGKIMTFFGRYSSVIWIDFEDFWQITTFLVYILGDFEDILPPPLGDNHHDQIYTTYGALFEQILTFFGRYPCVILMILDKLCHPPSGHYHYDHIYTFYHALFGQIMTFFSRYSSVSLRILDILWNPLPPSPGDNHHDQIYITSDMLAWFWGFLSNFDIFWPIF